MRFVAIALSLVLLSCSQGRQDTKPAGTESPAPAAALPSEKTTEPASAADPQAPRIAGRFAPRDECGVLPGWKPFAAKIRAAVTRRDSKAFAALASDKVLLDFGGGAGKAELVQRLESRSATDLWDDLDQLLVLGCAKGDGANAASMPWFWEQDLVGANPFEIWLVTGDAAPLLSAPDPEAKVRARLGWVLVRPVKEYVWKAPFQHVQVDGRSEQGFVEAKYLRSQVDYRLISERIGGTWRITHLIAGD